ncbi:MAG: cation-translocating P-type ATPase, partial [Flavisolibacter sp.]
MQGLSEKEVQVLLLQYGKNILPYKKSNRLLRIVKDLVSEIMFLLLVAACILYFILGSYAEGFMMLAALCFVTAISIYQEVRSSNALELLGQLTAPRVKVIREGIEKEIEIENLVPGDVFLLEEGESVPADAEILQQNDLSVNESIISGESLPVEKSLEKESNIIFQGTVLNSGRCTARVTKTGEQTVLGKIGKSISIYSESKTQLQHQVNKFFRRFSILGIAAFFLIFLINYLHNENLVASLLFGLTLAMSAIPEEIPVAFSSFMALGAYHLSRLGIISRQPQTVENLGAVNAICLDKTGTITENTMVVESIYDHHSGSLYKINDVKAPPSDVLYYGLLASELKPFDAMEKAIVEAYTGIFHLQQDLPMVKEYPLEGKPPMMTHVYEKDGYALAAAKGAVERIISICHLQEEEVATILNHTHTMAAKGYRVLGVASAIHNEKIMPAVQNDFNWKFEGLIGLYDPPKFFVKEVFKQFYEAGISVKLLTGDFPETALSIASETGLTYKGKCVTGEQVMNANDEEIKQIVRESDVFARMYPEAKVKVISALIKDGNVVAMTGDGVNDGPALKAANIGIAMGEKGTEVARQSADLIVTDDDLRKVADAVRQGRKIFGNFKKAIRYIISIHIPIILVASIPLLLGWKYPNIFTPIHIIFLELIMGPTCSIFYEREPVEDNIMKLPPRRKEARIFERNELLISIIQGIVIAIGILTLYHFYSNSGSSLAEVRTIVFTTLIL